MINVITCASTARAITMGQGLFLSKNEKCFTDIDDIRIRGNEAREGRNKTPSPHMIQYQPLEQDKEKIIRMQEIIHNAKPNTPFEKLPTTSEISCDHFRFMLRPSIMSSLKCMH